MIELSSVELNHSNASMGPHETKTEIRLSRSGFEEEFEKLLKETKINGVVTLEEYLQFYLDENNKEIEKVNKAFEPEALSVGGTVSALVFNITGGPTVELWDTRRYKIEGYYYSNFQKVLVENGSKHSYQPWGNPGGGLIDEDLPPKVPTETDFENKKESLPRPPVPKKPTQE